MRRFYLLGFLVLMGFDTLAQVSFKLAANHALPMDLSAAWLARVASEPWIYGAFVGYIGAFFTWMALLRHAPIGPAYAATHLEIVSVMLCSVWLFGEHISALQGVGAVLIVAGIVCLAIAESRQGGAAVKDDGGAGASADALPADASSSISR
ncbi:DMT family transporter [Pigmentiphaga litoralis]|uniref:Drug/metabolite transporter (DMT)-like permease n=1 Tax=Pigmentiphaga litoralis TaxID=516702 RepID=A0A7Y9IT35_9BURK|nr:EamA family transporter [Pigmentiphaga litoralis]NYE23791.1 drug/metabolite transporter (DMT)-like permease [Pigmentiphaga litoralis]NYE82595.1 drug/metabolite transporter (DMT)-like permease [Pigmentiphaga litoralis]